MEYSVHQDISFQNYTVVQPELEYSSEQNFSIPNELFQDSAFSEVLNNAHSKSAHVYTHPLPTPDMKQKVEY